MTKITKLKGLVCSVLSIPRGIIAGYQIAAGDIDKAAKSMRKVYRRYRKAGFDDWFANAVIEESYKKAGNKFKERGRLDLVVNTFISRNYYHETYSTGIA